MIRLDIGMVTYEVMKPQCKRSVIQALVVREDIGMVTYEAMTHQCGRSVVQVLVVADLKLYLSCMPYSISMKDKDDMFAYKWFESSNKKMQTFELNISSSSEITVS